MVDDDIERDNLEDENMLTGINSSLQVAGPFPFHEGEGTSQELMEAGRFIDAPQELTEMGHTADVPQELTGASRSALSRPSEQREGSKHPCTDETEQGSGGLSPKCRCCPVAPR